MSDQNDKERCGNCHCWRGLPVAGGTGDCRFGPPTLLPTGAVRHPQTNADHWCYQWVAMEAGESKLEPAAQAIAKAAIRPDQFPKPKRK